jgi:hypothetical protein
VDPLSPELGGFDWFLLLGCGVLRLLKIPLIKKADRNYGNIEEKTTERDVG